MSGAGFKAAADWTVETLRGIEVRAAADPAKVNPPGAWVQPVKARPRNLAGEWDVDVNVYLTTGNGNNVLGSLDDLVEKVAGVLVIREGVETELEVVSLELPGGGAALPAVLYPITVQTP